MTGPPVSAHLRIDQEPDGAYRVLLNGMPLEMLLAPDGLDIHFSPEGQEDHVSRPEVFLRFAPGALDLHLDAELVTELLRTPVEDPSETERVG